MRWLLLLVALTVSVQAQEVEVGNGLICDTAEQVIAYNKAYKGDVAAALEVVNENAPNSCGVMGVAYVRGEEVGRVRTRDGPAAIVRIAIVGIWTAGGWVRVRPSEQFTLFVIKEDGA